MKRLGILISCILCLLLLTVALAIPASAASASFDIGQSGAVSVAPAAPVSVDEAEHLCVASCLDSNSQVASSTVNDFYFVIPETKLTNTATIERRTITTYIRPELSLPEILKVFAGWSYPLLFPIEAGA